MAVLRLPLDAAKVAGSVEVALLSNGGARERAYCEVLHGI